jgi:dihydroflavonol-4-reductase
LVPAAGPQSAGREPQKEAFILKILVTGGTGFIGSHLCEALIERGHHVTILVRPDDDTRWVDALPLARAMGDITDKGSLAAAVGDVDCVFHLAAILGAPDPQLYFRVNVDGTRNLVEACLESPRPPRRFLLASSIAAMGPSGKHRTYNEEAPCHPLSDYGKSKWQSEQELHRLDGRLPWTIVRLPLVFGPRSKGGLFPLMRVVNKGIKLRMGDGQTNVAYVADIVDGMITAVESDNTIGQTYLLGESPSFTWKEIMDAMAKAMGRRAISVWLPFHLLYLAGAISMAIGWLRRRRPFLHLRNVAYLRHRYWRVDTRKAEREFGYTTRHRLAEGLTLTAGWYSDQDLL